MPRTLTHADLATLRNIYAVAAERYDEDATVMLQLASLDAPVEGSRLPTVQAAQRLAEQFDRQARDARCYADLFEDAERPSLEPVCGRGFQGDSDHRFSQRN